MNDPEQTCEQCDGDLSEVAFCVPCWNKLGGEIIAKGESVNTLTQKLETMTRERNEARNECMLVNADLTDTKLQVESFREELAATAGWLATQDSAAAQDVCRRIRSVIENRKCDHPKPHGILNGAVICGACGREVEKRVEEKPEVPTIRSCNVHADCNAADEKARAKGKHFADHCSDEGCSECFGN